MQMSSGPPQRPSRFAFDARIDSSVASGVLDDDPLSEALRGSAFTDDPLAGGPADETTDVSRSAASDSAEIPLDGGDNSLRRHQNGSGRWRLPDGGGGGGGGGLLASGTSHIDTYASYGQLLTGAHNPPGSSDAGLDDEEVASFGRPPPSSQRRSPTAASARLPAHGASAGGSASTASGGAAGAAAGRYPRQQHISRAGAPDHHRPPAGQPVERVIEVGDPVKKMEGGMFPSMKGGHVLYKVTSAAPSAPAVSVRRRFSDFVALADKLKGSHRGYFLPLRPDKQHSPLEQQAADSGFVVERARELEHWLCALQAHPVVGASQELTGFLEDASGNSESWAQMQPRNGGVLNGVARLPRQLLGQEPAVPSVEEAAQSTRKTGDLLRRFKETKVTMHQPPPPTDEELDLQGKRRGLEEWAAVLVSASRHAEELALRLSGAASCTRELGMEMIKYGRFQDDDKVAPGRYTAAGSAVAAVASDAQKAGKAGVAAGRMGAHATDAATQALQPLHDMLAVAPAAIKALREREAALLTEQALQEEADQKRDAIATLQREGSKVYGSDQGKRRRVEGLEKEVRDLDRALSAAAAEYRRVLGHNQEELGRLQTHRSERLAYLLHSLAAVQHDAAARTATTWRQVAADLERLSPSTRPGSAVAAGFCSGPS